MLATILVALAFPGCGADSSIPSGGDPDRPTEPLILDGDSPIPPASVIDENPTILAEPLEGLSGSMLWSFRMGGLSADSLEQLRFAWDFGDGIAKVGDQVTHAYNEAGTYVVTVHATEPDGEIVFNHLGAVDVAAPMSAPRNQLQVYFVSESDIQGGKILLSARAQSSALHSGEQIWYRWDFASGTQVEGPEVVELLSGASPYRVTLTGETSEGRTSTYARVFTLPSGNGDNTIDLGGQEVEDGDPPANPDDPTDPVDPDETDPTIMPVIADAGPDQEIAPGDTVTLDGSSSEYDEDADVVARWRQVGGPKLLLASPHALVTSFVAPVGQMTDMTFDFELTVSQGEQSDSDQVRVHLDPLAGQPNAPPTTPSDGPLVAFPGAEGFGAGAIGGRGGRVVYVTTLEDYRRYTTPIVGSLRWAVEQVNGPRTVLFKVGGNINLLENLLIKGEECSYLTIAGQSAPGDGIQLTRFGVALIDDAHDVILRYLRIRPGYTSAAEWNKDCITLYGNNGRSVRNVIVDHCSLEWAIDEIANPWGKVENVTFQWCIFGEGSIFGHPKLEHSMGFLAGGADSTSETYLSVHHNLFVNNMSRNPNIASAGGVIHIVNNFICNAGSHEMRLYRASVQGEPGAYYPGSNRINIIANAFARGDAYTITGDRREVIVDSLVNDNSIYVSQNLTYVPHAFTRIDDWDIVGDMSAPAGHGISRLNSSKRRMSPWPDDIAAPITIHSSSSVRDVVLDGAGAIYPYRDSVDMRLIHEAETGTGAVGFGSSPADMMPWPILSGGSAPTDTDGDGMPDGWETERRLNPQDDRDGVLDRDGDGYSNLEEYLNGLVE